jgi:plastocyanin
VHAIAVQLAPLLAAEKSKTPFYVAGGLLVAWALIVSLGLGRRKPDFPGSLNGQRIVGAISAVLVLGALTTAVATSGAPTALGEEGAAASKSAAQQKQESANKPATSSPGESPAKQESTSTTGTGPTSGKQPAGKAPAGKAPAVKPTAGKPSAGTSPKATTGTPAPPSSPAAAVSELKLAANPAGQLAFDTKQLSAKAGTVTIDFSNASPIEHDVAIAAGGAVLGQTPVFTGGSKKLTLKLKAGTYTFFCSVPGHRQAGMEGTLTVS